MMKSPKQARLERAQAAIEAKKDYGELERDAATTLGYMLFEYSRLDMELGLFLVWSDEGRGLEKLTRQLEDSSFSKRLGLLEKLALSKYVGTPTADHYARWLSDAHAIRDLRNQLFHGRWGFSPSQQQVANVVGLPTSPGQTETRYSLDQLNESLQAMRNLRSRLSELREAWPV